MQYWLLKSEPEAFSWADLLQLGHTMWDGVRNYQARNHLKAMKVGDIAFFYHSGKEKSLKGTVKVVKKGYPDPTSPPPHAWLVVNIVPLLPLSPHLTLFMLKKETLLSNMELIRNPRLSVQRVNAAEYDHILHLNATLSL